jgi:hypothetical protein
MRQFMDEDESPEEASPPLPEVCRHLRTKTAFGHSVGYREWQRGQSSTAVYWCLKTMQTVGADDDFAHPHKCLRGRSCYQPLADE